MNPLDRVPLGGTGVTVTRLGMGLAPIGGLFAPVGDRAATDTVEAAWQAGIRFFDTAPHYGAGLSERRAGQALRHRPRTEFTLATKVGRRLVPGPPDPAGMWAEPTGDEPVFDFSAAGVRAAYEDSLSRLGVDRADVLHIHDPDHHFEPALTGALPALVELREAGLTGAVSAGMNQSAMLTDFARTGYFDCFLLAGRYSLLDQSALTDLLPECATRGISVIVGGVYNSGILANPAPGATYDYAPATPAVLARAQQIEQVCARHEVPLRAAALQFPLGHPAVATVLVGMRSPAEVADAIAMASVQIPGALWHDLKTAGLLDKEVPVP
ncbi:aldo/keto reductase [Paractinoplanes rishiriensis]|uniref:Oxidoreductase n=1 Tax=Paractinoplanes rishiriensis TaxID=1050105 RepID=A0A919MY35_9ACTN|nr:aldo/keto reductase [Actinoplanes rishiriensis]GIE99384.1 oxidoreductase [Actinoplanes rishiriensis]